MNTREQRIANLRAGRARVAAAGGRVGGPPPYGWRAQRGELIPDPDEQGARWLILWLHRQGQSQQQICDALEALGIPPRSSAHWSKPTVRAVILRALGAGELGALRAPAPSPGQLEMEGVRTGT